jgi:hypothetical protein
MINKHLTKTTPIYSVKNQDYSVKLLKAVKTNHGIVFTAEIVDGSDAGKWTSVYKKDLKIRE